jgi:uncharacterized protein
VRTCDVADLSPLTAPQARVLGSLIEKQLTLDDEPPLTLNALVMACNQTTSRDPVVQFDADLVETTALVLKSKGLVRVVHPGSGVRSTKYRQVADEAWGWSPAERALMCVLLLRGAQTVNELKTRTERLFAFGTGDEVEIALRALAARPEPQVALVERQPGQKEQRWIQLLEQDPEGRAAAPSSTRVTAERTPGRIEDLEARVAALESELASLRTALGDLVDLPSAASQQ